MNFALLAPAALASLAALLLPLLIHLARRSELRSVDFAALRWLRAGQRPRRNLRIENWPLLLLRLLLLALLALWLARPVLQGASDHKPYVAVMPGITPDTVDAEQLPRDARLHWLAAGFPPIASMSPGPQPIASLLRQLDSELPDDVSLTVFVTVQFDGTDAQRPQLSRPVDWRIVAGDISEVVNAPSLPAPALEIHADAAHQNAARYLRAAASAWRAENAAAARDTPPVLAWLGSGALPKAQLQEIERGGTALLDADATSPAVKWTVLWRDDSGNALLETGRLANGRMLRFVRPLQPEVMPVLLDADFPQRLLDALQSAPTPQRADARAFTPAVGATRHQLPAHDLQPWLALLIALSLAAERWIATRQQGPRSA